MPTSDSYGYLLDMDGVIYRGSAPIPAALDFLKRLEQRRIPFLFVTNHSCFTPVQLQEKLSAMGISVPLYSFYTSAMATADWLIGEGISRVFAIGEAGLFHALKEAGIEHDECGVSHVIVGFDRKLNYEKLKTAARLIESGAQLVGTNADSSYPVEDGNAPECGLLLGALYGATGAVPHIIGKPETTIFYEAAKRLGISHDRITMIGDRLDTDIAGALRSGMRSVIVLTGHTTRGMLDGSGIQPHAVLENLHLLEREPPAGDNQLEVKD